MIIHNILRFGPSSFFSCLKFERRHQMLKSFTVNCNWLNVCKSIAEKYVNRLELENSGLFEYSVHPVAMSKTSINYDKDNRIKEIIYCGISFRNDKSTIIINKSKEMFQIGNIIEKSGAVFFLGHKLTNLQFCHELTAYSFDEIDNETREIKFEHIWKNFGHVYSFGGNRYVFFNTFFYL